MFDYLIIAIVVIVVISAHGWLYLWVKFKLDEGSILKYLQDSKASDEQLVMDSETISSTLNISQKRVSSVCGKSSHIEELPGSNEHWILSQQ
ncbi:MAG: hypothetical protein V7459_07820 [Oceanicoccus sp.]